jgi:hypothetical protein
MVNVSQAALPNIRTLSSGYRHHRFLSPTAANDPKQTFSPTWFMIVSDPVLGYRKENFKRE